VSDGASPVVRRRRLAAELRRLRGAAGKTLDDVAEYLECSAAKVSRIESGHVGARIQDVRDMLDLYGVTGAEREALLDLVRQSRQKAWWHAYADMIPDEFRTMIGLEDEATTIWTYESQLIPGLLQAEGYSRAIMSTRRDDPASIIERGMRLRTTRKAVLNREHPPSYSAVINEAALHRPVGAPEVMDEQYAHLITVAASPAVTIQVLPFEAGADGDDSIPFVILGFADLTEPKVVYVEHLTAAFYINKAEQVGRYLAQFDSLRGRALSPTDSVDLIRRLRLQYRTGLGLEPAAGGTPA
jgi:transcriptional regulator with XRE-family HTH domain